MDPIFSATPPLESLRVLLARAAAEKPSESADPRTVQLIDVSRAHFYADAVRDVFIRLPDEDPMSSSAGRCGRLKKTMYGTLDAADRWAAHYSAVLTAAGFVQGRASPCHFWHPSKDIWVLVHGDDFVSVAREDGQKFLHRTLSAAYEVKLSQAGPRPGQARELRILGRVITFTEDGLQLEADPQHAEVAIAELGLTEAKGVATPGVKDDGGTSEAELRRLRQGYEHGSAYKCCAPSGAGDPESAAASAAPPRTISACEKGRGETSARGETSESAISACEKGRGETSARGETSESAISACE